MIRFTLAVLCSAVAVLSACQEDPVHLTAEPTATLIEDREGYFSLSEDEKAPSSFEPFLEDNPEDRWRRVAALNWYSREGDIDRLKHHTARMIEHHPAEMMIRFANSTAFYQDREYLLRVVDQLEGRLAEGAREHGLYWNLAAICEKGATPPVNDDPQRRARFLRYYGLPDDTVLLREVDNGLAAKAVQYFRDAIDTAAGDDFYVVFYSEQLVGLLRALDRNAEAVQVCERALRHADSVAAPDFFATYGECLWSTRKIEKAKQILKSVRSRDTEGFSRGPGHATTRAETYLGLISLREGDVAGARDLLLSSCQVQQCCHNITKGFPLLLAYELLEAGERDAVVEFCRIVERDFTPDRPEIQALLDQALEPVNQKASAGSESS